MYNKILVPMDGSKLAECVLPHLETIARGCATKNVMFIRVIEPVLPLMGGDDLGAFDAEMWSQIETQSKAEAEQYLTSLVSNAKYDSVDVQANVLQGGRAADIIADYAKKNNIDLIILATHGRSGVSRWVMGSVADRVMRSAPMPVLMIRAPGCGPGI